MGAAPSKGAEPRVILDFILREMFSRADLTDIYSLADPNKCSKYIVIASDALEKMFVKLNLYPNKAKDGTLYFQSVDGLTKGTSGAAKEIRLLQRKYCLELAFFFIRIFQTFAALTLSVFDTELPIVDPIEETTAAGPQRRATFIEPGAFLGLAQKPGASRGWFGQGGVLFDRGGSGAPTKGSFQIRDPSQSAYVQTPYSLLNYYLNPPVAGRQDMKGSMRFSGFDTMTISQSSLYTFTPSNLADDRLPKPQEVMKPRVSYIFERGGNTRGANVIQATLEIIQSDGYQIMLSDFAIDNQFQPKVVAKKAFLAEVQDEILYVGDEYPSARRKTLPYLLQAMFERAVIEALGEPPFSVVKFLRKMRYVGDSTTNPLQISGTNIWIRPGQEGASRIAIIYRDSIILSGDSKKTNVAVQAELEITKPVLSATDNSYTYRVYLDFSNKKVQPSDLADYLTFPSVSQPKKFVAYSLEKQTKVFLHFYRENSKQFWKTKVRISLTNRV
jgi:hypothetical protein